MSGFQLKFDVFPDNNETNKSAVAGIVEMVYLKSKT